MRYPQIRNNVTSILSILSSEGPKTRRELFEAIKPKLHNKSWSDLFARAPSENDQRHFARTGKFPRRLAASLPLRGMIELRGKEGNSFIWDITPYGYEVLLNKVLTSK